MNVQVVTFHLNGVTREQYLEMCSDLAPRFSAVPGLQAKFWIGDPGSGTYGGVYVWGDRTSMEDFLESELFEGTSRLFTAVASEDYELLAGFPPAGVEPEAEPGVPDDGAPEGATGPDLEAELAEEAAEEAIARQVIDPAASSAAARLREAMRRVWMDQAVWTHQWVSAQVTGAPMAPAIRDRLSRNNGDIVARLRPFYGDDSVDDLADLLGRHVTIAERVVQAAIEDDEPAFLSAFRDWSDNSDELVSVFTEWNPHWVAEALRALVRDHLTLVKRGMGATFDQAWERAIAQVDEDITRALTLADIVAGGIVVQFPARFLPVAGDEPGPGWPEAGDQHERDGEGLGFPAAGRPAERPERRQRFGG
jgi:hypothetical protein